jgi:hypothetical protein
VYTCTKPVCALCTDLCAMQVAKTERRAAADRRQEVEWLKYELKSSRYVYNCSDKYSL